MGYLSRRRFIAAAAAGLAVPLIAACATPNAPSPTAAPANPTSPAPTAAAPAPAKPAAASSPTVAPQPTAAPAKREIVQWKHATTGPSYGWVLQKMGAERGYFQEEGIELEYVTLNTDATINKGLLAGEVDSADTGASSVIVAAAQGAQIKVLGAWLHKLNHDLMVRSHINSVPDLAGKNVAITSQGGLPHVVMLAVFDKYGVDPSSVNFVSLNLANETHVQALLAGTVDSGVASAELRLIIQDRPEVKVLAPFASEIPEFIRTTMIVTNDTYAKRQDVLERLIRAYSRGVNDALTNKAAAVDLGMKLTGTSEEINAFSFDIWSQQGWGNPSGVVPMSSMEYMQSLNLKLGLQEKPVDLNALYDSSIARKVAQELGYKIPS